MNVFEANPKWLLVAVFYAVGRCDVFQDGDDIQDVTFVNKAFSYLFEEQETSCPIAVVSRPQTSTTQPTTVPKSLKYPCNDYPKNYDGNRIFTKKNLLETPDQLLICYFGFVSKNCSCTLKDLYFYRADDKSFEDPFIMRQAVRDYRPNSFQTVCADYNVDAPNAVAEYRCKGTERVDTPIFYVHHADKCRSP
ncbi:unnamed protein product [Cylicocyclus nassatus]|uniref:Uncharacterized protein n=1 Tax=Cylicocyclus nassatus TaxID=53992 RepID=A0AA36H121_CYLNA|nr:unnamed protein product [Cylicocyclus nassatus]